VRILLDTHIFLWFIAGDAKLDDHSRELIENPDSDMLSPLKRGSF